MFEAESNSWGTVRAIGQSFKDYAVELSVAVINQFDSSHQQASLFPYVFTILADPCPAPTFGLIIKLVIDDPDLYKVLFNSYKLICHPESCVNGAVQICPLGLPIHLGPPVPASLSTWCIAPRW